MAGGGSVLLPSAQYRRDPRIVRELYRIEFAVGHPGEGQKPLLKEDSGLAACRLRGRVKVRAHLLLVGSQRRLQVRGESVALRAAYEIRTSHGAAEYNPACPPTAECGRNES